MAWILVEGLDRSGKSSVAEHYRKQGYAVVHMEAPSKKYYSETYSGESYLEELVRMYTKYDGQKVLFDRTIYGELVWPNIYGRQALLESEDLEYLAQIEKNNSAEKILMYDANTEAHWQRCVDNNEPLTRQQFGRASIFYDRLSREYGFKKKQLTDFPEILQKTESPKQQVQALDTQKANEGLRGNDGNTNSAGLSKQVSGVGERTGDSASTAVDIQRSLPDLEARLQLANTIREVLQGKILRKKGGAYDDLEKDIKDFLQKKLEEVFVGKPVEQNFSEDEIMILKLYAQRIKEKM
jgi:thymidylate kinase